MIKHLYIHTLGCQMNVYDSEQMAKLLSSFGYKITRSIKTADVILVNTCAIREKAEQKMFSFLGRLGKLKKKKPDMIIAVGGCVAQQEGKKILTRVPYVNLVFGTHAIHRLPKLFQQVESSKKRVVDIEMGQEIKEFETRENSQKNTACSTKFVTIMQGCDNYCTYCVVPYVRGREMSRQPEHIIKEIKNLVRYGVREVTLLGQNVNSYGQKEGLCSFAELLEQVNEIEGLYRIRFTTSHPKDLSEDLIHAFKHLDKLCRHIHLPVQSGSNRILKRMNRKYSKELYLEKVELLRQVSPDIAISSDMIVGFPGETPADFEQTLDLIKKIEYDSLFVFKYSDRPNAPAAHFSDKIPELEKQKRFEVLLELQETFTKKKNQSLIGTTQEILIDGLSKRQIKESSSSENLQWTGRTTHNKIVNFVSNDDSPPLIGEMIDVKIKKAFSHSLWGEWGVGILTL